MSIQTALSSHYIIRGGAAGRERLRVLARVMRPSLLRLFDHLGLREGMSCLDVGCGGGDVTYDLARIVGPEGRVLGTDMDETKLEIVGKEAAGQELSNIDVRLADAVDAVPEKDFDFCFARFLLTHVPD